MSETFFETAQAILTGYDTALSKQWREEDRVWRKEDLAWRERERYYNDANIEFMEEERLWRLEDMDQRLLDNIRVLWQRFVDRTRSDVEERSEQLKGISSLAALVAGFAVSGFLQFEIPETSGWGLLMAFGISTALVVALMMNAMMTCSLIQASILKTGRKFVAEAEEAAFVHDCLDWYKSYSPGMRPPAPQKTFTRHWTAQCEGEWVRAFAMFSAGVPVFFFNLAVAGWIKFSFSSSTAIGITVVMGIALAYFIFSQFRWVAHLLEKQEVDVARTYEGGVCRLPFDWHLPPDPTVRRRRSASRQVSCLSGRSMASEMNSRAADANSELESAQEPPAPFAFPDDCRGPPDDSNPHEHIFALHRNASSFTTGRRVQRFGSSIANLDSTPEDEAMVAGAPNHDGIDRIPSDQQVNGSSSSNDEEGDVGQRVHDAYRRMITSVSRRIDAHRKHIQDQQQNDV